MSATLITTIKYAIQMCVNRITVCTLYTLMTRSPTWRYGRTSVQPVDVFWSYRVTVSAPTAAGLLPSLARRPGTLSRITSGIRTLQWTTSSACWKRFCSQRISAISALDVPWRCALQIYILLTYLLIHILQYKGKRSWTGLSNRTWSTHQ